MKIILALLCIAELFSSVWYVRTFKNGFNTKTLLIKMLCSGIFVATGIISAVYSGGFGSLYPLLLVIGLVCSWFGDVLLHKAESMPRYITGGLGFLAAHVLYITAFIKTAATPVFALRDIIIMLCAYALAAVLYFVLKLKAGKLLVPIMIYAAVLCFMLSKAVNLGIIEIGKGVYAGGIILILGALLFVLSDFMLGISFLGNTTYKKQAVNMLAYFPAQMLLALSILFIK